MIYADYAAATPLDKQVLAQMQPYFAEQFYNPSSLYPQARLVREALEKARTQVAKRIGAQGEQIVFTSGGTESDNLAVLGTALHPNQKKRHLITSAVEHHALLESCAWLEGQGFRVTYLPVDCWGRVDPKDLSDAMTDDTFLVSIMWVNNELGTIQDIRELTRIAHAGGALFHTDAVQAMTTQDIDVEAEKVDMLSLSSHKFYGPKGAGALYIKDSTVLSPTQHGGQQEQHLRGGTENVPAIIGMGAAAWMLQEQVQEKRGKLKRWKAQMTEAFSSIEGVRINSPQAYSADSILHLAFSEIEAEGLLFWLARGGIQVSMGSACNSQSVEPSHVVQAIGLSNQFARGCIRISLGCGITDAQVEQLIEGIKEAAQHLRARMKAYQ